MALRNKSFSKELAVVTEANDGNLEGGNGWCMVWVGLGCGIGGGAFDMEWFNGMDKYGFCY